ncbi:alpha/beta hydrolase [Streptomyces sp. NPDC051940]|uniref:alpha/beta fold hydrolase n=1 Tax=Streptomyces sp. NPDC051940 TaxID=3155675 RepID=UPI003420FE43
MHKIESADGTVIAFDQIGSGPPLIIVAGASCDRSVDAALADELARHMTVLNYDRRGRGDSGDTQPYAVAREIDDIRALTDAAGGSASLLGLSSGAVLAARAAADGVPVDRLIMWEPPFSLDDEARRRTSEYAARLGGLLAENRRGDALALFMSLVGMPEEVIEGMRHSPHFQQGLALAHTLAYDAAVMGDGSIPEDTLTRIQAPTLLLAGSRSPAFLCAAAERAAAAIPDARQAVLADQDHNVAPDVIAPVVARFTGTTHDV